MNDLLRHVLARQALDRQVLGSTACQPPPEPPSRDPRKQLKVADTQSAWSPFSSASEGENHRESGLGPSAAPATPAPQPPATLPTVGRTPSLAGSKQGRSEPLGGDKQRVPNNSVEDIAANSAAGHKQGNPQKGVSQQQGGATEHAGGLVAVEGKEEREQLLQRKAELEEQVREAKQKLDLAKEQSKEGEWKSMCHLRELKEKLHFRNSENKLKRQRIEAMESRIRSFHERKQKVREIFER